MRVVRTKNAMLSVVYRLLDDEEIDKEELAGNILMSLEDLIIVEKELDSVVRRNLTIPIKTGKFKNE